MDVPFGTYDISLEYISCKTKAYSDKSITKCINLVTVSLALNIESLEEVTIITVHSVGGYRNGANDFDFEG